MFTQLHTTSGFLTFVVVLLSRVCLSQRPFLYDIVDGSWKISLSNGCWFIKCHLLIRISLMFGTVEWYCFITKGKIRFFFPFGREPVYVFQILLLRVCCQLSFSGSISLSRVCLTLPSNFSFKRIIPEESQRFFFDEAFLCSQLVTRCGEFVSECLCWFEVGSHVKNWPPVESFTLIDSGV